MEGDRPEEGVPGDGAAGTEPEPEPSTMTAAQFTKRTQWPEPQPDGLALELDSAEAEQAAEPQPAQQTRVQLQVQVPPGVQPGQVLDVAVISGKEEQHYNVTVPEGLAPGDTFTLDPYALAVLASPASPSVIGLSGEETTRLSKEFGLPTVIKVTDQALKVFKEIRLAKDGHLSLEEFAKALGQLGAKSPGDGQRSLASFMFSAIDTNDSGTLSFAEFVEWMLTMLSGTTERKRRFGFDLCDADGDGLIQRSEIAALLSSIFGVLSGLSLGDHNPDEQLFLDELFGKFGEGGETLSWEQWQRACTEWSDTILHLGHTRHVGERLGAGRTHALLEGQQEEEGRREQKGEMAFFGQERWEFMLTLMLGLQIAVEDSKEELDRAAQVSPTPWPLADDLSRWAAF